MFFLPLLLIVCVWLVADVWAQENVNSGVHINEFLPDPEGADTEGEFIELYNNSDQDVDVSGWTIDTGGSFTFALDAGTIIPPRGFLTFYSAEKRISLTNSGDHIKLIRSGQGAVVQDDIVYTASKTGYSYNRKADGTYEQLSTPTPNAENTIPATPTPVPTLTPTPTLIPTLTPSPSLSPTPTPTGVIATVYSSDVHINEFLPDPAGDDTTQEFIELRNFGTEIIDLSGWILDDLVDGGSTPFSIPDGTSIPANGFLLLSRLQTKLSMNNDSDHVRLVRPDGVIQDDISYTDTTEGRSYNRVTTENYQQSSTITPGAANIITIPSPKPTSAPDEEKEGDIAYEFSLKIFINEVLPSPRGSDTEDEFIEIKSQDMKSIRLLGWTLDDGDGGSSPYHFTEVDTISSGKILVFFRSKTKIALNNDEDSIRLIDPNGKVVSLVNYEPKVMEGQSYNRTSEGLFAWSEIITPGQENTIYIQEVASPTPKAKAVKKAAAPKKATSTTRAGSSVGTPRVLSAISGSLPWPGLSQEEGTVSRKVVLSRGLASSSGKQKAFIFFGVTAAFVQGLSGLTNKERIWRK